MITMKDEKILFFIQKRVGIATTLTSFSVALSNFLFYVSTGNPLTIEKILANVVLLIGIGVLYFFLSLINKPFIRFIQMAVFLLLGLVGTALGDPGVMVGPVFVSLAFIYALQYGFLQKNLLLKLIPTIVIYTAFVVFITINKEGYNIYPALITIIISLDLFYLIWIAFAPMLEESEKEKEKLHEELKEHRMYVKLGRNTIGTIHNIRSKLATVRTYGQMMKSASKEETPAFLDKQEIAIRDILEMLESILSNVRSYGEMELKPCNLKDFVMTSLEFKKADLDFKHGVQVSTDLAQESAILGNPKDLVTIIESLLDNAQEAMAHREERLLTISARDERHTVKLTITDNGPGIPFCNPCRHGFECLECTEFHVGRSTKEKGSGIGLTLVRDSIKRLNADMRVESVPGKGTSFHIWFPRYEGLGKTEDVLPAG